MGERMRLLLEKAAAEFERGSDPFNSDFLSDNGITLDECGDLSSAIASIIQGYLSMPKEERVKFLALGAFTETFKDNPRHQEARKLFGDLLDFHAARLDLARRKG